MFFQDNPHLEVICSKPADDILKAFITTNTKSDSVLLSHQQLCQMLVKNNILPLFALWEAAKIIQKCQVSITDELSASC